MLHSLSSRSLLILPVLALALPLLTAAQQVLPLSEDGARRPKTAAPAARRVAALSLPFFDDFAADPSDADPTPDPAYWEPRGGAYVNNRFGLDPPTRGVASLDGLDGRGRGYGSSFSDLDTLTSRAIDLSGRTSVVLSFWWQAGGVGGNINAQASPGGIPSLWVEMSADDGAFWSVIPEWETNGAGATAFAQVFVPVTSNYLTNRFRFRFRASGYGKGNNNTWNVDYVELDANRTAAPGPRRDVALSRPLASALKRYTAMPVWQFNNAASPLNELNDSTGTTVDNLDLPTAIPTPVTYEARLTVTTLPDALPLTSDVFATGALVLPGGEWQRPIFASVRTAPVPPLTGIGKLLEQQITLASGELDLRTRANDVIRRQTELSTYYAYDDGSAENLFTLNPSTDTRYGAYAFSPDTADQVAGVALYLYPGGRAGQLQYVNLWAPDPADPTHPAQQPRYQQAFRQPADTTLRRLGGWYPVYFAIPQPVSGPFFAGYGQPPIANFPASQVGIDFNEKRAAGRFWVQVVGGNGTWQLLRFGAAPLGTVMIRPLMNRGGVLGLAADHETLAPDVYPNPATTGTVQLRGRFDGGLTVFDALGRAVRTAPAHATTLDVRGLPAGLYVLRFRHGATATATTTTTRRLVLTPGAE